MRTILKRDSRLFNYQQKFGATTEFLPTLFVGNPNTISDIEPMGSVMCTVFTADKVKSGETGKIYDHNYVWGKMIQAGKVSAGGASPQDGFAMAVTGQRVVPTGEIETSAGYFQCEIGQYDSFTNVKSAIQLEFNKGYKRPVGCGTHFYPNWVGQTVLSQVQGDPSEHEWQIVGWDETHQDCFQIDAHLGFYQYIPKDIFNETMDELYGTVALTLSETTQEEIDALKAIKVSLIKRMLDWCYNRVKILTARLQTIQKTSGFPPVLYAISKNVLGTKQTLNDNVPPEVGCAEAVSSILQKAGVIVPSGGIQGTAELYIWLKNNIRFVQVSEPEVGCIIISPTSSTGKISHGHVGIVAMYNLMYNNDWGIISNDSDTGLVREKWNVKNWIAYYQTYGGLDIAYFKLL